MKPLWASGFGAQMREILFGGNVIYGKFGRKGEAGAHGTLEELLRQDF